MIFCSLKAIDSGRHVYLHQGVYACLADWLDSLKWGIRTGGP